MYLFNLYIQILLDNFRGIIGIAIEVKMKECHIIN